MNIEFYLNDQPIRLKDVRADATVLDFLRETKRLKGTKEGCAEGDCGACTVLVGRVQNGQLHYQAVNACITFVPMLHRTHLVTIEALSEGGSLHWIQQTLVDYHGSQCGFCTPGIVMSLYGAWMNASHALSSDDVKTALQGNLCRCTGYAPIVRGILAEQKSDQKSDRLFEHRADMLAKLQTISTEMVIMKGEAPFFIPQNSMELEAVYAEHPDATIVAGATDVGLWVTKQFRKIDPVIFIHQVPELEHIEITKKDIRIGAMVSYTQAQNELKDALPTLDAFWSRIAGAQVRNQGTIGGNIANGSPIGDTPPIWIALDAKLVLNQGGRRREVPIEDFFISYGKQNRDAGEFLEALIVPRSQKSLKVYKLSKRRDEDITAVGCALAFEWNGATLKDIRIAYAGMAEIPKRAQAAEAILRGHEPIEAKIREAMKALEADFAPISDMRASAAYRMKSAQNMLLRAFRELENETEAAE